MLSTLSVDSFAIPGDATFSLNSHYAAPASRADSGASQSGMYDEAVSHSRGRLFPTISGASEAGGCCTIGGTPVRGWNGEAKQVVDVIPEETFHEQKLGIIKLQRKEGGHVRTPLYTSIHTLRL